MGQASNMFRLGDTSANCKSFLQHSNLMIAHATGYKVEKVIPIYMEL